MSHHPQGIEMGAEIIAWGLTKGAEVGSHLMQKVTLVSWLIRLHVTEYHG